MVGLVGVGQAQFKGGAEPEGPGPDQVELGPAVQVHDVPQPGIGIDVLWLELLRLEAEQAREVVGKPDSEGWVVVGPVVPVAVFRPRSQAGGDADQAAYVAVQKLVAETVGVQEIVAAGVGFHAEVFAVDRLC